jgi:hypothetical protein
MAAPPPPNPYSKSEQQRLLVRLRMSRFFTARVSGQTLRRPGKAAKTRCALLLLFLFAERITRSRASLWLPDEAQCGAFFRSVAFDKPALRLQIAKAAHSYSSVFLLDVCHVFLLVPAANSFFLE